MHKETFTPLMADQEFEYQETRFSPISKDDNCCYRCQRTLLDFDVFDLKHASSTNPGDEPPYPDAQDEFERAENKMWFKKNTGRMKEEALRWSDIAGYYSNNLDGVRMCLVLCEDCKLEILGPFMKFKDAMYGPGQYHRTRWKQRNDQDVQNRWDARKQRRALHAALPNIGSMNVGKRL